MTDPYDVWFHLEVSEGAEQIVARVPQCENQVVQATTFDALTTAVRQLVVAYVGDISEDDVVLGAINEESEADFLSATS